MYGRHPDQLTDEEFGYCREFVALALIEQDEGRPPESGAGDLDGAITGASHQTG